MFATLSRRPASLALLAVSLSILGPAGLASKALAFGPESASPVADLRLIASEPGPGGRIEGVLRIDLEEGWKTYWLDPGPSGIPPRIDVAAGPDAGTTTLFAPIPHRFGEDLARANGYDADVDLPFVLEPRTAKTGEKADQGPVTAEVFIGVCREICVPVQASLKAESGENGDGDGDGAIAAAFERLPVPLSPGTVTARIEGDSLLVGLSGTRSVSDAFVLGPKGWYFGEPGEPSRSAGQTVFRVPIEERPKAKAKADAGPGDALPLEVLFADGGKGLSATVEAR
ncbi:protein-disulfide reductase DsbD domain-containing protein [Fulvimarina endophytica]|nr:protein-disulfide reductase DsbD domain-containing protein [Fulvimarina endophytica]